MVSVLLTATGGAVQAQAQTATVYDSMGREIGTATTDHGVTTFRDQRGRETGSAQRQPDGRIQYRDGMGRETGTASPRR
jgi:hypothetical protein